MSEHGSLCDCDNCREQSLDAWYEAEDCGCSCNELSDIGSEWEWMPDQGCYVCVGCGEVQ